MKKYIQFLLFWTVNSALLFLANAVFPEKYALGNSIFIPLQSVAFTGLVWAFVVWNVEKMAKDFEIDMKGNMEMMLVYLAVNFAALWLMARFAFIFGFGVFNFVWVLLLAFVANIVQYLVWNYSQKK